MCDIQDPEKNILHSIKLMTESKLLCLQSGFLSGRSTTEQIMTCFHLEAAITQKRSLTIAFVDYGMAFDSVCRRAIPVVLRRCSIPDMVVVDVVQLYHGSIMAVSTHF